MAEQMIEAWPLRYRLKGGRLTHVARVANGGEDDFTVTACGHMVVSGDHQLSPSADWRTCEACVRRLRHPRVGDPRQRTPDAERVNDEGNRVTTMRIKRCCNGCGAVLGDADNRDVDRTGNLTDVRAECPTCNGTGAAS